MKKAQIPQRSLTTQKGPTKACWSFVANSRVCVRITISLFLAWHTLASLLDQNSLDFLSIAELHNGAPVAAHCRKSCAWILLERFRMRLVVLTLLSIYKPRTDVAKIVASWHTLVLPKQLCFTELLKQMRA